MADKLRRTFPLVITHTEGEQPSHLKLNAITQQARSALGIVELAVGDLWNQAGDPIMNLHPLQIPNIARQIGKAKFLNPAIYPTQSDFYFVEELEDDYAGQTEFYLQFKPAEAIIIEEDAGNLMSVLKSNAYEVENSGDYHVDLETGKVTLGIAVPEFVNTIKVKYKVSPSTDWIQQQEVLPGVIPDPRQEDFVGCRIENSGGTFLLHLPPRLPLTLDSEETPHNYPTSDQLDDNQQSTLDTNDRRLWQDEESNAFSDAHYRYSLPKELLDILSSLPVGNVLPSGFLYLWDQQNQTIISDVVFKKSGSSNSWVLEIESTTLDLADLATSDESSASYDSGYGLICVGNSLSASIWELRNIIGQAHHDNTGPEPVLDHGNLKGNNPPPDSSSNEHDGRYPSDSPSAWPASRWNDDHHTYLLSRLGSKGISGGEARDIYDNAMLGDLVFANKSPANYLDETLPNGSYGIYFGSIDGNKLWSSTQGQLDWDGDLAIDGDTETSWLFTNIHGATYHGLENKEGSHIRSIEPTFNQTTISGLDLSALGTTAVDRVWRHNSFVYLSDTTNNDFYRAEVDAYAMHEDDLLSNFTDLSSEAGGGFQDIKIAGNYLFGLDSSSPVAGDRIHKIKIRDGYSHIFQDVDESVSDGTHDTAKTITLAYVRGQSAGEEVKVFSVGSMPGASDRTYIAKWNAYLGTDNLDASSEEIIELTSAFTGGTEFTHAGGIVALEKHLYVLCKDSGNAALVKINMETMSFVSSLDTGNSADFFDVGGLFTDGRYIFMAYEATTGPGLNLHLVFPKDFSADAPTMKIDGINLSTPTNFGGIVAINKEVYFSVSTTAFNGIFGTNYEDRTANIQGGGAEEDYAIANFNDSSGHITSDGRYIYMVSNNNLHRVML